MNEYAVSGPTDSLRESPSTARTVVLFTDMEGGEATAVAGPFDGVLITLTSLRVTGTGEEFAAFDPEGDRWMFGGVGYTDAEVLVYDEVN